MKATKKTPAKNAISHAAAEAAWRRIREIFETPDGERWMTLLMAIIDHKREEALRRDEEMAAATDTGPGGGQLLCVLGEILALRRLSTAQLFELGSSEEAIQLCAEIFARGLREPSGDGHVIRFNRNRWIGDPPSPKEAPPEVEEDETFAGPEEPEK